MADTTLLILKYSSVVGVWLMTFLFAILPVTWKKFRSSQLVLSQANSFSGGLFLAAGLCHILPEAAENLEEYQEGQKKDGEEAGEMFPWPFFAATVSFSFILLIDKVIFNGSHSHGGVGDHDHGHNHNKNHDDGILSHTKSDAYDNVDNGEGNVRMTRSKTLIDTLVKSMVKDHFADDEKRQVPMMVDEDLNDDEMEEEFKYKVGQKRSLALRASMHSQANKNKKKINKSGIMSDDSHGLKSEDNLKPMVNQVDINNDELPQSPYVLALAMGVHAAFAGQALGLTKNVGDCLSLIAAIGTHKWAEAMTVGVSFAKALSQVGMKQTMILITIFSLSTPIGIQIGIPLSGVNQLVQSILMGASSGTFVYIASAEIIVEEFAMSKHVWVKYLFYQIGFAVMASVWFIEQALGAEQLRENFNMVEIIKKDMFEILI